MGQWAPSTLLVEVPAGESFATPSVALSPSLHVQLRVPLCSALLLFLSGRSSATAEGMPLSDDGLAAYDLIRACLAGDSVRKSEPWQNLSAFGGVFHKAQ